MLAEFQLAYVFYAHAPWNLQAYLCVSNISFVSASIVVFVQSFHGAVFNGSNLNVVPATAAVLCIGRMYASIYYM